MTDQVDSTLSRNVRAMTASNERLHRTIMLLIKLVAGLYVWALLLSMEVFDFVDIDIEPGDALPEMSWEHVLAHGHNILAALVLLGGIIAAARHIWQHLKGTYTITDQ